VGEYNGRHKGSKEGKQRKSRIQDSLGLKDQRKKKEFEDLYSLEDFPTQEEEGSKRIEEHSEGSPIQY
tara:strand:+ start:2001 stop:2204 length:204 start_codon:yes stop_codon:yes gene_type:complete